ncbi:amidohydrolase, partial [Salmonella enterica subsp. enterica serovar Saintpaul]
TLASITRIAQAESIASGADKEPAVTSMHTFPVTVVDDGAMQAIAAVFPEHFGAERGVGSPSPLAGSEDVGIFGTTAGVPTAFWFWGGYEQQRFEEAAAAGKPVPSNHSPEFAPVLEPTLSTGIEALTVA